jgi:hypothetical protein
MKNKHRNIEFEVHRVDGKRWAMGCLSNDAAGHICFVGTVDGDEEEVRPPLEMK